MDITECISFSEYLEQVKDHALSEVNEEEVKAEYNAGYSPHEAVINLGLA